MRCRIGDLAIVVRSAYPANRDAIVEVIGTGVQGFDWKVRSKGRLLRGVSVDGAPMACTTLHCYDYQLRPLRPEEGTDEVIRYAGKPQETHRDVIKSQTT